MNKNDCIIKVLSLWVNSANISKEMFEFKQSCKAMIENTPYDFIGENLSKIEFDLLNDEDIESLANALLAL